MLSTIAYTPRTIAALRPRPATVSPEEREAGVLAKIHQCRIPAGFWLCWVDADKVFVDQNRDRLDHELAKRVAAYHPVYVDIPSCTCRRDGRLPGLHLYVEDGQYTLQMLRVRDAIPTLKEGVNVVECLVNFDLNRKEGSGYMGVKNDSDSRAKMGTWDRVKKFAEGEAASVDGDILGREEKILVLLAERFSLSTPLTTTLAKADLRFAQEYVRICKGTSLPKECRSRGEVILSQVFQLHATCFRGQKLSQVFVRQLAIFLAKRRPPIHQMIRAFSFPECVAWVENKVAQRVARAKAKDKKASSRPDGDYYQDVLTGLALSAKIPLKAAA